MLTAFEGVARVLIYLQGGKKKMKNQMNDTRRNELHSRNLIGHQFGGSVLMQQSFRRSQYMESCKYSSTRMATKSSSARQIHLNEASLRPTDKEEMLYHFPTEAYPEYRKIPFLVSIFISILIISSYFFLLCVYATTKLTLREFYHIDTYSKLCFHIITELVLVAIFILILQDLYYYPSRFTTDTLIRKRWFPSKLSRFSKIDMEIPPELNHDENSDEVIKVNSIGVHFLEYKNKSKAMDDNDCDIFKRDSGFDIVHFMHGFGASSLNWISIIKPLVEILNAKVAIAHDAVAFGFTDRPPTRFQIRNDLAPYTSAGWAMLGNSLIMDRLEKDNRGSNSNDLMKKRAVLIGHSMGCAATLKMALTLPSFEKIVILVSPALVGSPPDRKSRSDENHSEKNGSIRTYIIDLLKQFASTFNININHYVGYFHLWIIEPILKYVLSRGVGTPGFWLTLLQHIGGFRPSDEHCLAFQWPSIGFGWEQGLLNFAKSRTLSVCPYAGGELELLDDVLMLPEVSLFIIHGTDDNLVPISMSRRIVENAIVDIKLIEMEGLGHVPMLQKPQDFMDIIKDVIYESSGDWNKKEV